MVGTVATINSIKGILDKNKTDMANSLVYLYQDWRIQRDQWIEEKKELRNYLFATDTTSTSNNELPWMNKTTMPKLTQIRDNLHANYMDALFPNDDWLIWEGDDVDSVSKEKRKILELYAKNKANASGLRQTVSDLLYDYIDTGNVFGEVIWINETHVDPVTQEDVTTYMGPKLLRISPYDIVFNPVAPSFVKSAKFTRYVMSIGELKKQLTTRTDLQFDPEVFNNMLERRRELSTFKKEDIDKADGYIADGFGTLSTYYGSGVVELLEFTGDWYDAVNDVLHENKIITIVDRTEIIRNIDNPNWFGTDGKQHVGWRDRPDNLYSMGPLDNLVGLQYRLDHLENFKADAMDQTILPPLKIIGDVQPFKWGPGEKIFLPEDGDVVSMPPNAAVFQANNEIAYIMQMMEELAGSPKQSMGIRTPGEKTAFEVQALENASGRIFNNKILKFSIQFLEPIMNLFIESAKRNLNTKDVLRVVDSDVGVIQFMEITKDDITAKGKLRPVGARHYAARAQLMQNLTGVFNSPMGQIIQPDLSRKALTSLIEETMGLTRYQLFSTNIAITEQMETQRMVQEAQTTVQNESITSVDENMVAPQEEAPFDEVEEPEE
jgi:hypothetical protein